MLRGLIKEKPYKYGLYSNLEMLKYLVEKESFSVVIYGAGRNGLILRDWLEQIYGICIGFFIDKEPKEAMYDNIKVITIEESKKELEKEHKVIAVVSVGAFKTEPLQRKIITENLKACGIKLIVDGTFVVRPYKVGWEPQFFKNNMDKFEETFQLMSDEISKKTFYEYLKSYITGKRYAGPTFLEEYKYWGIDSDCEKIFSLLPDEVLLNVGACTGDTIFQFLKVADNFKKIIGVEADGENFRDLKNAISCLSEPIRRKIELKNMYLGEGNNTIDNLWADKKITLINMDIEGAELDVLATGVETIKSMRPILSVCAYHKRDDLIKIPQFIKNNFVDYVLVLRKYPSSFFMGVDSINQINELVIYAVPRERYMGN